MSKTWDILVVERPKKIPSTTVVTIEESVEGISPCGKFEKDGHLHFVVGPTFFNSRIISRKITFSYERDPLLDYEYDYAGQIEPGQLLSEGERVYIFLEK